MKNNSPGSLIGTLSFIIFLFMAGSLAGQSTTDQSCNEEALNSGEVCAVAARIASLYGADEKIVESFVEAAVNLENHSGIAAPIVIAIAIHESSFKSELFLNAGNPFGIKASSPWTGPTYTKQQDIEESKYRMYGSPEEAVEDFCNFIKSRTWYADALSCPLDDYRCVLDGLKKTDSELGYSTNPGWDEAVLGIIEKLKLQTLVTR